MRVFTRMALVSKAKHEVTMKKIALQDDTFIFVIQLLTTTYPIVFIIFHLLESGPHIF